MRPKKISYIAFLKIMRCLRNSIVAKFPLHHPYLGVFLSHQIICLLFFHFYLLIDWTFDDFSPFFWLSYFAMPTWENTSQGSKMRRMLKRIFTPWINDNLNTNRKILVSSVMVLECEVNWLGNLIFGRYSFESMIKRRKFLRFLDFLKKGWGKNYIHFFGSIFRVFGKKIWKNKKIQSPTFQKISSQISQKKTIFLLFWMKIQRISRQ